VTIVGHPRKRLLGASSPKAGSSRRGRTAMNGLLSGLRVFIDNLGLPYVLAVFLVFLAAEKWFYAERSQSVKGVLFNVRYTVLYLVVATLLQPVIGFVTSFAVASAGGGWIRPPQWFGTGRPNGIFQ